MDSTDSCVFSTLKLIIPPIFKLLSRMFSHFLMIVDQHLGAILNIGLPVHFSRWQQRFS